MPSAKEPVDDRGGAGGAAALKTSPAGVGVPKNDGSRQGEAQRPSDKTPAAVTDRGPREAFSSSDDHVVLLAIEPYWAFAYWQVHPRALEAARRRAGDADALLVLRMHQLGQTRDAEPAGAPFDIVVDSPQGTYYVNLWSSGKTLQAELGARAADGSFAALARSNVIELPRDSESPGFEDRRRRVRGAVGPSWSPRRAERIEADPPAWAAGAALSDDGDEAVNRHAPTSARSGAWAPPASLAGSPAASVPADSAPVPALDGPVETGVAPAAADPSSDPGAPAGGDTPAPVLAESRLEASDAFDGVSSEAVPIRDARPRLEVRADIVVYGRAAPGTEVVIDGVPVRVRGDGTFDIRFALAANPPAVPHTSTS